MRSIPLFPTDNFTAYFKFITVYQYVIKMDNEDLKHFISPENLVSQVLLAYFLALQFIMAPILDREYGQRSRVTPIRYHVIWIDSVLDLLPDTMRDLKE